MSTAKAKKQVFQLKVTLAEVSPVVWRRILVPADAALAHLHLVLQVAMGWNDSHLHCFETAGGRYGMIDLEEDSPDLLDERKVKLAKVLPNRKARLFYSYDYGDGWSHEVVLEAILPTDPRHRYPLCIGGGGACPPDDCGGPGGYGELVRVLRSPKDEEHDDMLTWVGGYFDPASFDANEVNRAFRFEEL